MNRPGTAQNQNPSDIRQVYGDRLQMKDPVLSQKMGQQYQKGKDYGKGRRHSHSPDSEVEPDEQNIQKNI
jgi:hypothetical protein